MKSGGLTTQYFWFGIAIVKVLLRIQPLERSILGAGHGQSNPWTRSVQGLETGVPGAGIETIVLVLDFRTDRSIP